MIFNLKKKKNMELKKELQSRWDIFDGAESYFIKLKFDIEYESDIKLKSIKSSIDVLKKEKRKIEKKLKELK